MDDDQKAMNDSTVHAVDGRMCNTWENLAIEEVISELSGFHESWGSY